MSDSSGMSRDHQVRIHAPSADDPIARIDAQIREAEGGIARLQKHVDDALTGEDLHARGSAAAPVLKKLKDDLRTLRTRRVRLIAGLPDEPDQVQAAAAKAAVSEPSPLPSNSAAIQRFVRENFKDEPALAEDALGFINAIRSVAAGSREVRSWTQGQSDALEVAIVSLRLSIARTLSENATLKQRLEQLEARCSDGLMKYAGLHQRALSYQKGSVVTLKGSAWVAIKDVAEGEIPGETDAWQLAVKAGRDGKDAAAQ